MSEVSGQDRGKTDGRGKLLRVMVYAAIVAQVLIYLYLYVYIGQHANPKGDGMEWVAVMPASFVLVIGIVPALLLLQWKRWLPIAVLAACVGVALNIAFFLEIVREMPGGH